MGFTTTFFKAVTLEEKLVAKNDNWEYTEEPHVGRRKAILEKHPEIKSLMGSDSFIAYIVVAEVLAQLALCVFISLYQPGFLTIFLLAYVFGGCLNHSLGSAIHEIGHNLAFGHRHAWANRVLGIVANLPNAVPFAISYKKYHQEHHRYFGNEWLDVDIPTRIETYLFRTTPRKILWLVLHPIIHAIRPFYKNPKPVTNWELVNIVVMFVVDVLIFEYLGAKALGYLFLSTFVSMGPHPLAAHFISEHYLFSDNNQATHSYYGPLNPILFNVGYHVEHHDFPYIPHTRLAEVKRMAPEFYDHLSHHTSWFKVMWDFIFLDKMGPHARSITELNATKPDMYAKMEKRDIE